MNDSTLTDTLFVEQCNYVKQYYHHLLHEEEKNVLNQLLTLPTGERRLLNAMYSFSEIRNIVIHEKVHSFMYPNAMYK